MRKIIALEFISLDGVMQAPGGPEEDISGGFEYGGWTAPYFDEAAGKMMDKQMNRPADLLLGRKTFDIFESYWPTHTSEWPTINTMTKYVVSKSRSTSDWQNSVFLKNVKELQKVKDQNAPDMHVYGSGNLLQTLLAQDMVDEMWLKIFPVTLGSGKRLFSKGTIPAAFQLLDSQVTPSGVIFASYKRAGEVKTGSF
jgi:dihydrofolate reductase